MRRHIIFSVLVAGLFMITGCSLSLNGEVKPDVKPTVQLGELPPSSQNPTTNPTQTSRQEGSQGIKSLVANLRIDPTLASALSLNATMNCAQLVELSNGTVLVDIAATQCPTSSILPASQILFSLGYNAIGNSTYELLYLDNNRSESVGRIIVNVNASTVTLTQLCNSSYSSNCYLYKNSGKITSIYVY